jgi:hypothetical protein
VLEPLRDSFDVILPDTPPGLGTLSGIAVLAADGLLISALAADLDVRGASKLYDLVEGEIPGLRILGVLIAASERRWRITRDAVQRMDADAMRVLPVHVPRAVRVASAPRYRAPTAVLEPESMASHAYASSLIICSRSSGYELPAADAVRAATTDPRDGERAGRSPAAKPDRGRPARGRRRGGSHVRAPAADS